MYIDLSQVTVQTERRCGFTVYVAWWRGERITSAFSNHGAINQAIQVLRLRLTKRA